MWNKFHSPPPLFPISGLRTQWSWLGSSLALVRAADKRVLINGMDKPQSRQFAPLDQTFHPSQVGLFQTHSVLEQLHLVQAVQRSPCCLNSSCLPRALREGQEQRSPTMTMTMKPATCPFTWGQPSCHPPILWR